METKTKKYDAIKVLPAVIDAINYWAGYYLIMPILGIGAFFLYFTAYREIFGSLIFLSLVEALFAYLYLRRS